MKIKEYEEEIKKAFIRMDSINFIPIFEKSNSFYEAKDLVETIYGDDIFNVITSDEFMDYINSRYKNEIVISEVINYVVRFLK